MNEEQATEAAFLLYMQVKLAVAMLLIKAKPEGANIREFVIALQNKVRKQTNRCNLYLERQIFRNQFILLLPEIKVYSVEHQPQNYKCSELEERVEESCRQFDDCSTLPPASADDVAPRTLETVTVLRKINSISGFVDTILKIKLLSEENRDIVLTDLIRMLSSTSVVPNNKDVGYTPDRNLIVSGSLLHYLINSVDAERIVTRGSLDIISLIEEYLDGEHEAHVTGQALKTIRSANNVIFKCLVTFPSTSTCCKRTIGSFLRKTLRSLCTTEKINRNHTACSNWYSAFGVWKEEEFTCVEMIKTLIDVLKDVEKGSYAHVAQSCFSLSECNLLLLKKLLISYLKMYVSKTAQPNESDINQWEETLRVTIAEFIPRHSNTVRLAWHCLRIVLSFKLLSTK